MVQFRIFYLGSNLIQINEGVILLGSGNDSYPVRRDQQRAMYANILAKIDGYKDVIDELDAARIDRIKLMCNTYMSIYDWLAQSEARLGGGYEFQKDMEKGDSAEIPTPPPPFASLALPAGAFIRFR